MHPSKSVITTREGGAGRGLRVRQSMKIHHLLEQISELWLLSLLPKYLRDTSCENIYRSREHELRNLEKMNRLSSQAAEPNVASRGLTCAKKESS